MVPDMLDRPSDNIRDRSREATRELRRYVEEAIAQRDLRPGDQLPTERDLAAKFGIGRNTVRKILVTLEREGKIERSVGRGTFIRPQRTEAPSAEAELAATVSR